MISLRQTIEAEARARAILLDLLPGDASRNRLYLTWRSR